MGHNKTNTKPSRVSGVAITAFFVSLVLCSFLVGTTIINKYNAENSLTEQIILEKSSRINEEISKLLYKTEALSALVVRYGGETDNFDIMAPAIVDNLGILNVILAPDGVVSKVYPLEGNEKVIGLNFFSHGAGNNEAIAARETGKLLLGGPFDLIQGGQALVGRLPLYIDTPMEDKKFWGLVSVTLKFPDVLNNAHLETLTNQGFSYELWRINPDTNERQVIAYNEEGAKPNSRFIEKPVHILNAKWVLRVSNLRAWYSYPDNIALIIASVFISFLVFFVVQNNFRLRQAKSELAILAKTDPLTGISNRRHFMEFAQSNMERARRLNEECCILLIDVDKFKNINDIYGHAMGDKVLSEIAARLKALIRPYDLFARYGGEEFIMFISHIKINDAMKFAERLRLELCNKKCEFSDISLAISASFGLAAIGSGNMEDAIKHADEALYKAKEEGRNKVILYEKL